MALNIGQHGAGFREPRSGRQLEAVQSACAGWCRRRSSIRSGSTSIRSRRTTDWNCLKEHRRLDDDCLGIEVHLSAASNCIAIKNLGATPICISTHQRQWGQREAAKCVSRLWRLHGHRSLSGKARL